MDKFLRPRLGQGYLAKTSLITENLVNLFQKKKFFLKKTKKKLTSDKKGFTFCKI